MKKLLLLLSFFIFNSSWLVLKAYAGDFAKDTVYTGIYVTSIHDIDFRQKEFSVNFWLWLKYKNKGFNFLQNVELPQAKTFVKSYDTMIVKKDSIYVLMKMQCVMKDSWKIDNFPFDRQNLRISIENSQFDSLKLVFAVDTIGKHYDTLTLRGWIIDSFRVWIASKSYETTFGDDELDTPHTVYSAFKVKIVIKRDAMGLFWKIFLGMYVAFLIAYISFYIHADNIESRFGLSVGALFAVVGNKYIVDSSLPETTTFTLVDTLHGITLLFIFLVITATAYALKLFKGEKFKRANRFDMITANILLLFYIILNISFIIRANSG